MGADMSLRTLFRISVVLSPLLVICGVAWRSYITPRISGDWQTLLLWDGQGSWLLPDVQELGAAASAAWLVLAIAALVTLLAIQAGLFFFRGWARTAYLVTMVLYIIAAPGFGLSINLPLESTFYELAALVDGFILTAAYFSPLRREFGKSRRIGRMWLQDPGPDALP
jgi:hypothetical protein